jgi:dihydroorotase
MDDESSLHALFCLASRHDLIVAVHAEDERMIKKRTLLFKGETSPHIHSIIRNANVAAKAVAKAISLSKLYRTKLYIAHVSTKAELDLIRKAKDKGLSVYAEATPHHLFLSDNAYGLLGTRALMNPPLRSEEDRQALWQAIHDGTIDTIGSDHAPHTLEEKMQPFGKAHAGVPGIETTLPLLFTAYDEGLITLEKIVALTRTNSEKIFSLPSNNDVVLVDLKKEKKLVEKDLKTRCGWSPYTGKMLKGWPAITIIGGKVYETSL